MNVTCSCCGEDRPADKVGTLQCHPETQVCRDCINWLHHQAGMVETTPTFPVADMATAIQFYRSLGFDVHAYDDGFAFVQFDGVSVFDLDLRPDTDATRNLSGCYLIVPDADTWHTRLSAAGVPTSTLENMPWGMREFAFSDPNGNRIRVGTSISTDTITSD